MESAQSVRMGSRQMARVLVLPVRWAVQRVLMAKRNSAQNALLDITNPGHNALNATVATELAFRVSPTA